MYLNYNCLFLIDESCSKGYKKISLYTHQILSMQLNRLQDHFNPPQELLIQRSIRKIGAMFIQWKAQVAPYSIF